MPILTIQRRHAEQGRIRLGQKVTTANGRTRPDKLDRFRFTSPNQRLIEAIAAQYGGTAQPWDNAGKAEHEVITEAKSIPVIAVKGGMSQWLETWSGGGCIHRCDGITNVLTGEPCDLDEQVRMGRDTINPHEAARPTTRLSVMLTEIETLGVWRMETKGWNAAAELPSMVELAQHVGDLVPAYLTLVERTAVREGKTSRFVVPVLDLQVSKARLVQIAGGHDGPAAVGQGPAPTALSQGEGPRAIEAPTPDYAAELADCDSVQCCRDLWARAGDAGHLDDGLRAAIQARVAELTPAADTDPPAAEQTVQGSTTDDEDAAWQELLTAAGNNNMSQSELESEFVQNMGVAPAAASAAQMRLFTQVLTTGEATQLPEGTDEQPGAVA